MNRFKMWFLRQAEKLSALTRGVVRVIGVLFGVYQQGPAKYEFGQVVLACGVFLFGVPVGMLFFGNAFNAATWMAVVIGCLWLVNLDDALLTIASMVDYGVDYTEPLSAQRAAQTA